VGDAVGLQADQGLALEVDLAGAGGEQAGDEVEHRGLAGAVGADEAVDAASGYFEADVLQHVQAAEMLADVTDGQQIGLLGGVHA